MRAVLLIAAAALAGACAPRGDSCDLSATRSIVFTAADAEDRVIARSFGQDCAHAIGVYTITAADGRPVWAWATPLPRAFGDTFEGADADEMRAFLERWSAPAVLTTSAAPEWDVLAPGQTTLDRLTYDDIRARNLPMLCHYSGTARQACVFYEPAAGGAGHFLDRDVDEEPPA